MQKILLVEDNEEVRKIIVASLHAMSVTCVTSIREATEMLARESFGLILLDILLPDGDGMKFFMALQSDEKIRPIPVIFLTCRNDLSHKVTAFSLGAEDYITKPFDPLELRARVEAKLRKFCNRKTDEDTINIGNLRIYFSRQQAFIIDNRSEKRIDLTPFEFKLLQHFARNPEKVFSRADLIAILWGSDVHVLDRTVDAHISNLRRKIKAAQYCIGSVYGAGYSFRSKVTVKSRQNLISNMTHEM